tara:strand:- start:567 stop:761 length:195 start_codon:yes stop_codon:yes gene_type:complete
MEFILYYQGWRALSRDSEKFIDFRLPNNLRELVYRPDQKGRVLFINVFVDSPDREIAGYYALAI